MRAFCVIQSRNHESWRNARFLQNQNNVSSVNELNKVVSIENNLKKYYLSFQGAVLPLYLNISVSCDRCSQKRCSRGTGLVQQSMENRKWARRKRGAFADLHVKSRISPEMETSCPISHFLLRNSQDCLLFTLFFSPQGGDFPTKRSSSQHMSLVAHRQTPLSPGPTTVPPTALTPLAPVSICLYIPLFILLFSYMNDLYRRSQ